VHDQGLTKDVDGIAPELMQQVRSEMGLPDTVPNDIEGLRTVYRAWCNSMTFDNIRKFISLNSGDESLAGSDAADYFQHWLSNRSGGTCWPSANALFTLVSSFCFDARRVAGSMFDVPPINHGSVKVRIKGNDWLVDSSMLTGEPLPLTDELDVRTDGPVRVEIEPNENGYLIWADFPPLPEFIPCRLREDPVDLAFFHERYEASREMSPFNERLYLRRLRPEGLTVFLGNTLFRRFGDDLEITPLNAENLCKVMQDVGGVSGPLISRWVDAGGLNATMNFSGQGPELPDPGPRPSRR